MAKGEAGMVNELNFGYDGLAELLTRQLDRRGWSKRELARRAGLSQTAVSGTVAGQRRPGADFCLKIARTIDEPPEQILRLAGLLPPGAADGDPDVQLALELLRQMAPATRRQALRLLRCLAREAGNE